MNWDSVLLGHARHLCFVLFFSVYSMLGEVRRPVNGYYNPSDPFPAAFPPRPSRSPQQSFVYGVEIISPPLIVWVKMNSVSREITTCTGDSQEEEEAGRERDRLKEEFVPQSQSWWMCEH